MLANDTCGLAFCSTGLGHNFGKNLGNELEVLMRGKGPHEPEFAYIFRIHSLMIYSDPVEYNFVGDTEVPLLRWFSFISKLKWGDVIKTGQYMNYQTFSNLQFRPLLKTSFQNLHIDLRDPFGQKIPFVSIGIIRLVLMYGKVSKIHFYHIRYYKMVASRQVEISYYRGVGRQKGRGFGALAQVIGRTAIPLLRKYVIPAAKRIGADMLEFPAPEVAEVISDRKSFKSAARSVGKQTVKKQLGEGSAGGREVVIREESFQQNLLNNPVARDEIFLQTFLVDHIKQQFSVPTFCGSVWKSWRESPKCLRCPLFPWTNLSN